MHLQLPHPLCAHSEHPPRSRTLCTQASQVSRQERRRALSCARESCCLGAPTLADSPLVGCCLHWTPAPLPHPDPHSGHHCSYHLDTAPHSHGAHSRCSPQPRCSCPRCQPVPVAWAPRAAPVTHCYTPAHRKFHPLLQPAPPPCRCPYPHPPAAPHQQPPLYPCVRACVVPPHRPRSASGCPRSAAALRALRTAACTRVEAATSCVCPPPPSVPHQGPAAPVHPAAAAAAARCPLVLPQRWAAGPLKAALTG